MSTRLTPDQIRNAVSVTVKGIPALAHVTTYLVVPPWQGSPKSCPSDLDYHGYTELEYDLHDTKGYRAEWLDKKLDRDVEDRIEEEILSIMGGIS